MAGRFSELADEHLQAAQAHIDLVHAYYAAVKAPPSDGLLGLILAVQSIAEALDCLRMQVDTVDARTEESA